MATELLPGFEEALEKGHRRRITRKRRVCKLSGHLFYAVTRDESTGRTVLECRRCWPHKDSIRVGYLYDLFPTAQEVD